MGQLYCGDNLEIMADMESESVDLTVTSPPYDDLRDYNGYTFDFENIAKQLYRITKQGGVVVWVVADKTKDGDESGTSFRQALYFKEIGFNLFDTMIYAKVQPTVTGFKGYYHCFDYMFVVSRGIPKTINLIVDRRNKKRANGGHTIRRQQNNIMRTSKGKEYKYKKWGVRKNIWEYKIGYNQSAKDKIAFQHPAIFPEKLAEDHILSWSNEGDLVFDPMCGSGTTGKMALKHNRDFIGIDCSEEYVEIARQRLKLLQG